MNPFEEIPKKEGDASYLNAIFRHIKPGEKENELRIESFKNFSPEMKNALLLVGKIFKDSKCSCPWTIQGSTALVLEGETSKQPVDIDLAFGAPDFEKVYDQFKKFEEKKLIRKLKTEEMKNFENNANGCIKIFAEIKVQEDPEAWIEIEAFAQNVDPQLPKNGIINPGLEKIGINIYADKYNNENIEMNFANREENFKFYLQLSYIELQKYQMDNRFMHIVKNKFPQRLQNLIAIIKREEREEFEKKLEKNEVSEDQKPNIENITDEQIERMIEEFIKYNSKNESLQLNDFAHSKMDPVKIMKERFNEFKEKKNIENNDKKGFVGRKIEIGDHIQNYTRENAIDELTMESLEDMEEIAKTHSKLIELRGKLNTLAKFCEENKNCDQETIEKIKKDAEEIFSKTKEVFNLISNIKNKYEKYLEIINYKDNRDFIAYIAIKQTISDYIIPSLELAIVSQNEIEEIRSKY